MVRDAPVCVVHDRIRRPEPVRALALSNRGETLFRLGRLDEAIADLESARMLYTRLESSLVSLIVDAAELARPT